MERLKTDGSTARLPEDVPDGVQLLDGSWLSKQRAGGARLTLLEPRELTRMDGAASALRAELDRALAEGDRAQAELTSAQGEHTRLELERDRAETDLAGLEARFATQKSANQAMLAAVGELEQSLHARDKTLRGLDHQLRTTQDESRELHRALDLAERPLWRKLLRRS